MHTDIQDSGHLAFPIWDPHVLPADSLHTFGKREQAFVDICRFNHSFLAVLRPAVVFRSSQINGRCRTDSGLIACCHRELYSENSV